MNNNIVEWLNSKGKVELSAQVIKLGLLQDVEASIADKTGMSQYESINSLTRSAYDAANTAQDAFRNKIERTEKLIAQLEQQAKDLGLGKISSVDSSKKLLLGDKERLKKVDSFLRNLSKATI